MPKLKVKFNKNKDATLENKDKLIHLLPPAYRIGRKEMEGMESGEILSLDIKNKSTAKKITEKLISELPVWVKLDD